MRAHVLLVLATMAWPSAAHGQAAPGPALESLTLERLEQLAPHGAEPLMLGSNEQRAAFGEPFGRT